MIVLAVETSTDACSCALHYRGEIRERCELAPRRHAELILSMADALLAEAGLVPGRLDGVSFGCGPGSFTGLRVACGVAQGIAFAADLPVAPVSSLAALAQDAADELGATSALAALDARMGEVYWGAYRIGGGLMRLIGEESVIAPADAPLPEGSGWLGVGSGWSVYGEALSQRLGAPPAGCAPERYPRARALLPLALAMFAAGQTVSAEQAQPVYLRNQVVQARR